MNNTINDDNLYELLGVRIDATSKELKEAYRKKIREVHPDMVGNTEYQNKMTAKINNAFEILRNPETRMAYDKKLRNATTSSIYNYQDNTITKHSIFDSYPDDYETYQKYSECDYTFEEQDEFIAWLRNFFEEYENNLKNSHSKYANLERIYFSLNNRIQDIINHEEETLKRMTNRKNK